MVFTKICGLRQPEHVLAAIDAGADAVGFVVTASPRFIDAAEVPALVKLVDGRVLTVAVFRDEPVDEVLRLADIAGVAAVQVHGRRNADEIAQLTASGLTVIRAVSAAEVDGDSMGEDLLLVDAPRPGSGEAWDYAAMREARPASDWLLAGGLAPDTVAEAITASGAWGVDVSSGVETAPGEKSTELIRAFLRAAGAQPRGGDDHD